MSDDLTCQERAAIEAAIAAGRRRVYPAGAYTVETYVGHGSRRRFVRKLIMPGEKEPWEDRLTRNRKSKVQHPTRQRGFGPTKPGLREQYAEVASPERTVAEIASMLGVGNEAARSNLLRLGLPYRRVRP